MSPAEQYAPEPSFMERVGLDLLRRHCDSPSARVERWSRDQQSAIDTVERGTVRRAAWTGAISGSSLAGAEIALRVWLADGGEAGDWREQWPFWTVYMAVVVAVSGAEIAYLYWIVLRAVAQMGSAAGLAFTRGEQEQVIAKGLTRAALDFPNPRTPIYGIDPYARVPRSRLLLYALAYRLKVGATSFVLRVVVRRVVARAAVRFLVPLLAVPVFAVWNAIIVRWVMRSARARAAGPVMIKELDELIAARREQLGETCRRLIVSAVEEAILRSCDAHPSYVLLLARLFDGLGLSPETERMPWPAARDRLSALTSEEQETVLAVLTVTVLIDGRLRRSETALLEEAHRACGHGFERLALEEPYRRFMNGQGFALDSP
jgi:hypothetical protein